MAKKKKFDIKEYLYKGKYFDYSLLLVVIILVVFGLVMVYSSSSYKSQADYGTSTHWLMRQGLSALLGFMVMYLVSMIEYHKWRRYVVILYFIMVGLQLYVNLFGAEVNGSKRWIMMGPLSVQPSEIAKFLIIIIWAHVLTKYHARMDRRYREIFKLIVPVCGPILILVVIENLSTTLVLAAIVVVMLFVSIKDYKIFFGIGLLGVLGVIVAVIAEPYRLERFRVLIDPSSTPSGYQTLQALYAIGSGGFFGKGLGQSMQKMGFIPESYNDMIFSVVCEELGLFGALCIVALILFLLYRCVVISLHAPDLFGSLLVVGVMAHIGIQVLINMLVVTNSIPPTGVPLPFISYGGTSIMFLLGEIGLVLSVSRHIRIKRDE
ncbi:MAG: FtsW/RodA/SpoVE family cell cycle protein [Lachnospiraceae bacterium]